MNVRLTISLVVAGALAFACGSPRSRTEPVATVSPADPHAPATMTTNGDEQTIKSHLDVGANKGKVVFALDVTNATKRRLELEFAGGQSYDIVVTDTTGKQVWRWAEGRIFTQSMQNKLLSKGETMHISERWVPPHPGRYVATATLRATNFPVSERVEFAAQ